ncbi:hypothetical protein ACWEOE_17430 [Amycolatopsis sp. NPDC004368]
MLYIVLVLVVAALALLVTALITAGPLWAWVSIGLSVVAGLILLVDWLRRRNRPDAGEAKPAGGEAAGAATAEELDAEQTALLPSRGELGDPADVPEPEIEPEPAAGTETKTEAGTAAAKESPAGGTVVAAGAGQAADKAVTTESAEKAPPVRETPPAEEETSAEDLAVVKELDDQVVVVDEYPRYHLVDCPWLSGRDTIPIGVGEARQLGFTPCARCGPDAVLAAAHR